MYVFLYMYKFTAVKFNLLIAGFNVGYVIG